MLTQQVDIVHIFLTPESPVPSGNRRLPPAPGAWDDERKRRSYAAFTNYALWVVTLPASITTVAVYGEYPRTLIVRVFSPADRFVNV